MKVVYTTTNDKDVAKKIAKSLLEKKLAKCIQIMPIESFYEWKNKIEQDNEYLLIIKSSSKFSKIEKEILANHNYELPEIIATNINEGYEKYLNWLKE